MNWIADLLKDIPLSVVLKEKISIVELKFAEAEKKIAVLESEKSDLTEKNVNLTMRVVELETENDILKTQLRVKTESENLDTDAQKLLRIIFERGGQFTAQDFAADLNLPQNEIDFLFNSLFKHKFIKPIGNPRFQAVTFYEITQKGREYIVKNKS